MSCFAIVCFSLWLKYPLWQPQAQHIIEVKAKHYKVVLFLSVIWCLLQLKSFTNASVRSHFESHVQFAIIDAYIFGVAGLFVYPGVSWGSNLWYQCGFLRKRMRSAAKTKNLQKFEELVAQTRQLVEINRFPLFAINLLSFTWLLSFFFNVSYYISTWTESRDNFLKISFWVAVVKQLWIQSLVLILDARVAHTGTEMDKAWKSVFKGATQNVDTGLLLNISGAALPYTQVSEQAKARSQSCLMHNNKGVSNVESSTFKRERSHVQAATLKSLQSRVDTLQAELAAANYCIYGLNHPPPVFNIYVFDLTPINMVRMLSVMLSLAISAFQVSLNILVVK